MSNPTLRGTEDGGILISWPDGYETAMIGPDWALSAVIAEVERRDDEVNFEATMRDLEARRRAAR